MPLAALQTYAKVFKLFSFKTMILYLNRSRRINFTQMSCFGDSCENRFRQNFQKEFDWASSNVSFVKHAQRHRVDITIDPSYINKSRKYTPGVCWYWYGCVGSAKWGMEILDIDLVDVDLKEAIYLKATQTVDTIKRERPPKYLAGMNNPNSLTAWYLRALAQEEDVLLKICNLIVADAFFSKESFVNGVKVLGFNLVNRFRNDVSMEYITHCYQCRKGLGRINSTCLCLELILSYTMQK